MSEKTYRSVRNWLIKAQRDLASARRLAEGDEPYFDTAIYHCQQAAEKALKGYLVFRDQRFEKTHDIRMLAALAATLEPQFADWIDTGARLTPYSVVFRYPDVLMEPEQTEFAQALRRAEELYKFVLSLLPAETHP